VSAPLIVGLTGAAGAGKDTAAAMLLQHAWRSIAFADALRVEVAAAWRVDPRLLVDRATKETPQRAFRVGNVEHREWLMFATVEGWSLLDERSPRWALQRWGEFRRRQDPDWWVKHVQVWLQLRARENHPGMVVTDVRFPNEAAALRAAGGHLVRVHRPGAGALAPDTASHESEGHTALQADAEIHNDGDLQHLQAEVWRVVQRLTLIANPHRTIHGDPHA